MQQSRKLHERFMSDLKRVCLKFVWLPRSIVRSQLLDEDTKESIDASVK